MDETCVKSIFNLCIFRRHMKLHEQDVEVFVKYVLKILLSIALESSVLEKARFRFLHTGSRCASDILKRPT